MGAKGLARGSSHAIRPWPDQEAYEGKGGAANENLAIYFWQIRGTDVIEISGVVERPNIVRPVAHHPAPPPHLPVFSGLFWREIPLCTNFTATAASRGRPPKLVLVTQSSRGIGLALLRLDLLEVKCSSLVKKYQGPRT